MLDQQELLDAIINDYGDNGEMESDLKDSFIIFHEYDDSDYSGSSETIFWKDCKIYTVTDSHCSCNGLEWQTPIEMSIEALEHMVTNASYGVYEEHSANIVAGIGIAKYFKEKNIQKIEDLTDEDLTYLKLKFDV